MWINSGNGFEYCRTIGKLRRRSPASLSASADFQMLYSCKTSSIQWWKHNEKPTSVKRLRSQADESPNFQFCALEYRPKDWNVASSQVAHIVLLVLRGKRGRLRFLIHPELPAVVMENDLPYIQSLLQDFNERAKVHPAGLFKQISSLGVGPLVLQMAGPSLSEYPAIQTLCSRFVEL